jgi:outer membrane protein OmpA-like peptidoglycan-associated protein
MKGGNMKRAVRIAIGTAVLLAAYAEMRPAQAKAPAAACLSGAFTVYFATGRWDLDGYAQAILREVILAIRSSRSTHVVVNGYADTIGAPGANQALSERRANEVRRFLIAEGAQASIISVRSFGESGLGVVTPDNTPEIRNRRVVVIVN